MKKTDNILWIFLHLHRSGGTAMNKEFNRILSPEEEFIHVGSPWLTEKEKKKKEIISFERRSLMQRQKARIISGHLAYYGIHKFVPGKVPKYFTFLREPTERLISFYQSRDWGDAKTIPSFEEWYNTRRKNEMVHFYGSKFLGYKETAQVPSALKKLHRIRNIEKLIFLSKKILKKLGFFSLGPQAEQNEFNNAKKLLDLCWFVGITENSAPALKFLSRAMGIKNFKITRPSKSQKKITISGEMRERIRKENPLDYELYEYALDLNKKQKKKFKIKN